MSALYLRKDPATQQQQQQKAAQLQTIACDQYKSPANPSSSPLSASTPPTASSSSSPMSPALHSNRPFDTFEPASSNARRTARIAVAFPSLGPRFRSQSEPLPTQDVDMDDGTEQPPPFHRARSEFSIRIPQEDPEYNTRDKLHILLEESEQFSSFSVEESQDKPKPKAAASLVRTHSTASTDILDPDSQDIMEDIVTKGIKIRDFAFKSAASSSVPPPPPVTEIFDQYKGLSEVDFRWAQPKRIYPIQGRTLRRLLTMGWLTREELDARGAPMDFEELEKHDAEKKHPWRPFPSTRIPSTAERMDIMMARRMLWYHVDKMRVQQENMDAWEAEMKRQADMQVSRMEAMECEVQYSAEQEKEKGKGKAPGPLRACESKRRFSNDENEVNVNEPKRRRITPEPSAQPSSSHSHSYSFSQESPYPVLLPPTKQYPAPLHTYNPELYPEAATVIESSQQSSSQPRPIVPPRSDTPPLDEEEQNAIQSNGPGRGAKLVHPRGMKMKGALSRTQTFTQLIV